MWLSTIGLLVTFALNVLMVPLAAAPPEKAARIGMLLGGSPDWTVPTLEIFRHALRELGYVEGQNIVIEYRFAEGRVDRLPTLAVELARLPVDVIVTWGTPAAWAAKHATSTLPIVIAAALDPVAQGLVPSLARPGGNLTGVTGSLLETTAKTVEVLKDAVPGLTRVAILWNPDNPGNKVGLREAQVAAQALGMQSQPLEVRDPNEFESAFAAMARERAEALLVIPEQLFLTHRTRLAALALEHRLPTMYERREFVEVGGLMSYGISFRDNFRRAAAYVDKILRGAKPGDLPIEQPMRFELVMNLKTAKALGLTIPPSILFQADEVIQ
jgi:putative ABC transport system substrate-binding protein